MLNIIFVSFMYSWFIAWIVFRSTQRRVYTVALLFLLPISLSLLVSFRDPPNSFYLFVYHSFISIIFTPFIYFILMSKNKAKEQIKGSTSELATDEKEGWSLWQSLLWVIVVPAIVLMALGRIL